MRHAIGYALHWPERKKLPVPRLDLAKIGQLEFSQPDPLRWPALGLADEVMRRGGLSGAMFNAAKERALDLFISGDIGFQDMAQVVDIVLNRHWKNAPSINEFDVIPLDDVLQADQIARMWTQEATRAHMNTA